MALSPTSSHGAASAGVVTKIYLNKPAATITRAATTIGAFSTPWQVTGVVVAGGQNVRVQANIAISRPATGDSLFAMFRDSTQIAAMLLTAQTLSDQRLFSWIDENPGAGTYTYEIRAAQFTGGTLTVFQTNITTDVGGGTSVLIAEVYTP